MAQERLAAHMIRDILRLHIGEGLPLRTAARACGVAASTAAEYCRRARARGLGWPLPAELDDGALGRALYGEEKPSVDPLRPPLDFDTIHLELRRKSVTLQLLWQEYRASNPEGYSYSQYCDLYRQWKRTLNVCMRQEHKAGAKLFVDYAGETMRYVDEKTGQSCEGQLFVAAQGASSYTYAEVTATQQLPEWISAHVHAYEYFGGIAQLTVSDCLRSAVKTPCRYEPEINRTYLEMGQHYGTVLLPARPAKPRDKAKVEAAVQVAERWILAVLRHRTLFGLGEVNRAVRELLERLNHRPMRRTGKSRAQLFEEIDRPALKPLPAAPYEYAEFGRATVNIDYHVAVDWNFYSVPYALVGQVVTVRRTLGTVEILHHTQRVAAHPRFRTGRGQYATIAEHRPKSHQKHLEWTPGRLIEWAGHTGPACGDLVRRILEERPHPESGYRSCLGIMRLAKQYGAQRMEAACRRALALGTCSYHSIKSILAHHLDSAPLPDADALIPAAGPRNDTVRGSHYYQ